MAKKREFASDSDVSMFITQKRETPIEKAEKNEDSLNKRKQFTIYVENDIMEQIKILAKLHDTNLNSIALELIKEALYKEEHQRGIQAYMRMKENL